MFDFGEIIFQSVARCLNGLVGIYLCFLKKKIACSIFFFIIFSSLYRYSYLISQTLNQKLKHLVQNEAFFITLLIKLP